MKRRFARLVGLALLALIPCSGGLHAQLFSLSQPLHVPILLNPAEVGNADHMRLKAFYRNQWLHIKSPYNVFGATYDMRFGGPSRHAMGVSLINDIQGPMTIQYTELMVYYAYGFDITYNFKLRLGLRGGAAMKSTNYNSLIFSDQLGLENPQAVASPYKNRILFSPDFSLGIQAELYRFEIGAAVHHVAEPYFDVRKDDYFRVKRQYIGTLKRPFNVFEQYRFKPPLMVTPSIIFNMQGQSALFLVGCSVDYIGVHASLWFKEGLYFSPMSNSHTVAASIGYTGKYMGIFYTYDMGFMQRFMGLDASVHELTLEVKFQYKRKSHLKPVFKRNKYYRKRSFRW